MKIRILGCSGAIARGCYTTSFLLDAHVLVDAGTGVGNLSFDEMRAIDHVFITHSHLDHIAALPLMLDTVGGVRKTPLQVYALEATLQALRTHIFNNTIWPDFTAIPSPAQPFVQLQPIAVGDVMEVAGLSLEVLPARHSVPAVGYGARGQGAWWVFSGDTQGNTPAFWERVNAMAQGPFGLGALVMETAFSNSEQALARLSQHLAPNDLARELRSLAADWQTLIYITHAKPRESQRIMREVQELEQNAFTLIDLQTVDALLL